MDCCGLVAIILAIFGGGTPDAVIVAVGMSEK